MIYNGRVDKLLRPLKTLSGRDAIELLESWCDECSVKIGAIIDDVEMNEMKDVL